MSDAIYKITVEHDPHSDANPFDWRVNLVSDGTFVVSGYSATEDDAVTDALEAAEREAGHLPTAYFYADANFEPCAPPVEPQSLRA